MFFELRQYRTKPGQREKWVKFMEEEIIPFQVAKGMVILGSFVGQAEDDLYVWIRRFDSEDERKRLYTAVYESDHWKNHIAPQIPIAERKNKRDFPADSVALSPHVQGSASRWRATIGAQSTLRGWP
jgi:hypothetical protein